MRTRRLLTRHLVAPETVLDSLTIELPCGPQELWEFVWDPASSLHAPGTEMATTLSGTPSGEVGEIQVFLHRVDGIRWLSALEVVEAQPPHVAVTRGLTGVFPGGGRLEISARGSGCVLVQGLHTVVPAGADAPYVELIHSAQRQTLDALRAALIDRFGQM